MRALGCRRSTADRLLGKLPLHEHPVVKARLVAHADGSNPLPAGVDWDAHSPRLDQNGYGACTAFAASGAIAAAFSIAGKPLPFVPSQRLIYAGTRAIERAMANVANPLPNLEDNGAMVSDVMTALQHYGIRPMYAAGVSDIDDATVNAEPQELDSTAPTFVATGYVLDPSQPNASDVIAAALESGILVDTAFFVDLNFQGIQPGQVAGAPTGDPNNPKPGEGGHSTYLNGYYTAPDGTRVFWLMNSWSAGFCENGRCRVGPAWVASAWEAWPCDFARGGA